MPRVAPTAIPEEHAQTPDELLSSIERDTENLRGIDTPPPVEHMFVDQAGMLERLAEEFEDPEVVEQITHESVPLKLLGIIPQDSDLAAVYERVLGGQVLGPYDPERSSFSCFATISREPSRSMLKRNSPIRTSTCADCRTQRSIWRRLPILSLATICR